MTALLLPESPRTCHCLQQAGHKGGITASPRSAKANGTGGAPAMTTLSQLGQLNPQESPREPGGSQQGPRSLFSSGAGEVSLLPEWSHPISGLLSALAPPPPA